MRKNKQRKPPTTNLKMQASFLSCKGKDTFGAKYLFVQRKAQK